MKHYLLPNKVQKTALAVLIADLIIIGLQSVLAVVCSSNESGLCVLFQGRLWQFITVTIAYGSLLALAFSKEKIEDEFMTSLRLQSVAIVFLIGISVVIVLNLAQTILPAEQYSVLKEWRMNRSWNGNYIILLMILYYATFKIKVHNLEKKMNDEE